MQVQCKNYVPLQKEESVVDMQVIFIHHSCFVVEVDGKVLIFDWFAGDRVQSFRFGGVLPEYEPDTPIYIFASHKHRDHFDMDVLHLAERYSDIHFVLSKDCRMSGNFLKNHGFAEDIVEKITYVTPGSRYHVSGLTIETLRSTDAGVAFLVQTNQMLIFHAGDLNNWKWDGAGELVNGMMEINYKAQIKRLSGKKIHLAFIPMDPRQKEYQFLGMNYFINHIDADYIFPMHMWQDYSGIEKCKKQIPDKALAEHVIEIQCENQIFNIED